jgi:hypothetical protein
MKSHLSASFITSDFGGSPSNPHLCWGAERWTNLDPALRDNADAGAGTVDFRPG